eukprot:TRINITY_DN3435_c0_g1_i2.p1 TRINITY_DN3435_c0_g1~~TRINITY_DN3435_c0_g1_i2.p1  ORF type:complete len:296 (+),score=9.12 TRINITY_DN3435_c0_g1_i2:105-992(+)
MSSPIFNSFTCISPASVLTCVLVRSDRSKAILSFVAYCLLPTPFAASLCSFRSHISLLQSTGAWFNASATGIIMVQGMFQPKHRVTTFPYTNVKRSLLTLSRGKMSGYFLNTSAAFFHSSSTSCLYLMPSKTSSESCSSFSSASLQNPSTSAFGNTSKYGFQKDLSPTKSPRVTFEHLEDYEHHQTQVLPVVVLLKQLLVLEEYPGYLRMPNAQVGDEEFVGNEEVSFVGQDIGCYQSSYQRALSKGHRILHLLTAHKANARMNRTVFFCPLIECNELGITLQFLGGRPIDFSLV